MATSQELCAPFNQSKWVFWGVRFDEAANKTVDVFGSQRDEVMKGQNNHFGGVVVCAVLRKDEKINGDIVRVSASPFE